MPKSEEMYIAETDLVLYEDPAFMKIAKTVPKGQQVGIVYPWPQGNKIIWIVNKPAPLFGDYYFPDPVAQTPTPTSNQNTTGSGIPKSSNSSVPAPKKNYTKYIKPTLIGIGVIAGLYLILKPKKAKSI